jgi:hypothetical protein
MDEQRATHHSSTTGIALLTFLHIGGYGMKARMPMHLSPRSSVASEKMKSARHARAIRE